MGGGGGPMHGGYRGEHVEHHSTKGKGSNYGRQENGQLILLPDTMLATVFPFSPSKSSFSLRTVPSLFIYLTGNLFEACSPRSLCESPNVCRHSICLPKEAPTPVLDMGIFPNGDAQRTLQILEEITRAAQQQLAGEIDKDQLAQALETVINQINATATTTALPVPSTVKPANSLKPMESIVACQPACIGTARCVANQCVCFVPNYVYLSTYGCVSQGFSTLLNSIPTPSLPYPFIPGILPEQGRRTNIMLLPNPGLPDYQSARFVAPIPPTIPHGFMRPQAFPGESCSLAGTECTGGSQCTFGYCICPPQLILAGSVCVLPPSINPFLSGYPSFLKNRL
ncbi:unnamed protein product, partial [Mesorhabditis belari]|uniref:EB domain-containing protein n=1 Tax=Mesorhabditis belari TaxID=2138241 RepID=A0AAF3EAF8_9BILA